ncbi:hypothetical protein EIN_473210 [Entamoeba invadens IP1]|uniref:Right handed beta helix domain-containing protein n=1 Tax=Entamoeba invadens IP1 TaxID=370355 RepID=A0A0A1U6B2_ENTIV|nr:hypothetical protein EIN_473210 [Entamoeba invadens IP1]ELP89913.1 hypothetical protein EIN_473210 [Entamoeba invadens IP1]|eukprot:XP_004256684.1 hypothetical protein EIN_473210 [Entamoeba invadens IP1]
MSSITSSNVIEPVTIYIKSGYYPLINNSLKFTTWTFKNSIIPRPITLTKYPNEDPPVITGGVKIPISSFRSLNSETDKVQYEKNQTLKRKNIKVCDLDKLNDQIDLGVYDADSNSEIYVDDKRFRVARYPNYEYTDTSHQTERIYILPPSDTSVQLTPNVTGYYIPRKEVLCGNETTFKSEKSVDGKYYYLYKNDSNYWTLSTRSDCGVPTQSDGAYFTVKRSAIAGEVIAVQESGAKGNPVLQQPNYIYRGNMWTAFASEKMGKTFYYANDKLDEYAKYDSVWMRGYWLIFSQDQAVKGNIDKNNRTVTIDRNMGDANDKGINSGMPFYIYNLIEELDEEGEYYIDYTEKKLYIYLPTTVDKVWISQSTSLLINVNTFNGLTIQNIIFEYTRKDMININLSRDILIKNCIFRHSGLKGIYLSGNHSTITNNTFYDIGAEGVFMRCDLLLLVS